MRAAAAVVAFAACLHVALWGYFQPKTEAPNIPGPLASMSYAPFEGITHPDDIANRPTAEQIRKDLKNIAPYTNSIRTYSSTGGLELVPQIAAEFGLKVTLGIWLDEDVARNEREIRAAVELAKRHSNVKAIVVGNETTLRGSLVRERTDVSAALAKDAPAYKTALRDERKADEAAIAKEADAAHRPVADLRLERNVDVLIKIISRVKKQVSVPVTTGETWDIWMGYDARLEQQYQGEALKAEQDRRINIAFRLAASVDFIAAHILPYWDRSTAANAVEHTLVVYNKLRKMHEGKRVVIAEFGWPSGGYNRGASEPGLMEQASIFRDFVSRADAMGIDYNVIEAYDQPWKSFEGSVGSYWGLFDASRTPKFSWTGPITNPDYNKLAAIAVAAGVLISLPLLAMAGATMGQLLMLALASHMVGAWAATVFDYWNSHYFVFGAAFAFFVATLLLIPLVIITLSRIQEIATILFGRSPRRLLPTGLRSAEGYTPKVSIHIPAYRESPEMLKATLNAIAALDYTNYECIVVINNTPDPAMWRPIEDHCVLLGERFKFINIDGLPGFKAGALRLAMSRTAPDAEIIGVLDADYVVQPDWLKDLTPVFIDPKVGLIQAPQDHRDGERSVMHQAMNSEYAGFFDIGMVQRNEANAIIVHGTMCLVRRAALEQAGGWSSDTICEDTDLGLTILENGWVTHYTNKRYGHGLLPDTFAAYKKQRDRWAYGGVQIARKHWRRMLPGTSRLVAEQRREFSMGWLNWLGAESVGVVVAILNLLWVPVVAFVGIAIPDKILTLPILATFIVSIAHFVALYRARVRITPGQMMTAMVAAMSMQWTVARAVGTGLIRDHLPFVVTAKGGVAKKRTVFPAFNEAIMGGLLLVGATIIVMTNYEGVREVNLFAAVLVVQSLPFLAAVAIGLLEESAINSFAYWRSLGAQVAEPLGLGTPSAAQQATLQPALPASLQASLQTSLIEAVVPVEKTIEAAGASFAPAMAQATQFHSTAFDATATGPGRGTVIS
jgi:cellulose synthase/poly-beta-1,6-N-acetylglucosamine synthase-like glycosyltransferase/exo-beta-1,3-glucanase (GH17 family)